MTSESISINPIIYNASLLKDINHILLSEVIFPIEGEGTYIKYTGHYGHIKIRVSKNKMLANPQTISNWMVGDDIIPGVYKKNVEKILSFFIAYIEALTGKKNSFVFDIIGGSYHPVDGRPIDYEHATLNCIINAFDNNICRPSLDRIYAG